MAKPSLDVCFSPITLPLHEVRGNIVVVIDILRATSTICTALSNGAREIVPVASIEDCLKYREKGYLLAGERDGEKVDGFDMGNSPFEYMNGVIKGRSIALTTTNGTRSIELIKKAASKIVAGSFLNIGVLCDWLKGQQKNTLLLCAGWKNRLNLEDSIFAGVVVHRLKVHFDCGFDSSKAAEQLYLYNKNDILKALKQASHYQRLNKLGVTKDIEYCLQLNKTKVLPIVKNGALVRLSSRMDRLAVKI